MPVASQRPAAAEYRNGDRTIPRGRGKPFSIPPGDVNGDGVVDLNDSWPGSYTVRCDYDLDGDVDFDDENIHVFATATLGRGILSDLTLGNRRGYCGYEHDGGIDTMCHVRNRVLLTELGRWTRRDPLGYVDGMGLYGYISANAINKNDPYGLAPSGGLNDPRPNPGELGKFQPAACIDIPDNPNPLQICFGGVTFPCSTPGVPCTRRRINNLCQFMMIVACYYIGEPCPMGPPSCSDARVHDLAISKCRELPEPDTATGCGSDCTCNVINYECTSQIKPNTYFDSITPTCGIQYEYEYIRETCIGDGTCATEIAG